MDYSFHDRTDTSDGDTSKEKRAGKSQTGEKNLQNTQMKEKKEKDGTSDENDEWNGGDTRKEKEPEGKKNLILI